jgi:tripartite-type tricarboxylate transporter receptor subunit TctC
MEEGMKKILVFMLILTVLSGLYAKGQGDSGGPAAVPSAEAVKYPASNNMTITVPYVAGGAADVIVRKIASLLEPKLGKPVVIVNRTGGGGVIAATEYLKEKPNTDTAILLSRAALVSIPLVQPNPVPYSVNDYIPVIGIENVDFILFANPKTGITDMKSLIAYANSKSSLKYGSVGAGTDVAVLQQCLYGLAGIKAEAVVYGGGAKEALLAVANGVVDVAAAATTAVGDMVDTGKVLPVGIFSDKPYAGFPGKTVPAFTEQGYNLNMPGKNFLAIRAGTDKAIIDYLYESIKEIYASPEYQKFAKTIQLSIDDSSSEDLVKYLSDQKAVVEKLKNHIK